MNYPDNLRYTKDHEWVELRRQYGNDRYYRFCTT